MLITFVRGDVLVSSSCIIYPTIPSGKLYFLCALTLDPVIALQQTSYTFPESTPEVDASICVVLESPSGGLALPFGVTFTIIPGTASTLHVIVSYTVVSILIV